MFIRWIKKMKWVVFLLLLGAGGFYFYQYNRAPVQPSYITEAVVQGDLEETVLATGTIDAHQSVRVGAQVSGQIKALHVVLGQSVKKGDLIAEIDAITQENMLKDKQATLHNYQAQLEAKQVGLEKAALLWKREQSLFAQGASAQETLENAKTALAAAKAEVSLVKSQIEQTNIALSTAKTNLTYTLIRSPMDGVVVSIPVEQGQTVNANQAAPTIVKIAQLDKVKIKAEIAEGDVPKIKPNTLVYFSILGDSTQQYHAVLAGIDPGPKSLSDGTSTETISSTSGTAIYYYAVFDVPNPAHRLKISMTAQVTIVLKEAKNALLIPSAALKKEGKKYTVKVLDAQKKMRRQEVTVGINNNAQAQILSGLALGDQVVVSESNDKVKQTAMRPVRMM